MFPILPGAMRLRASNFSITGSKSLGVGLPPNQGKEAVK